MTDDTSCTQWPYFIWKFKNFHNITRVVKENCTVENVHFNLILEQKFSEEPEAVWFKMYIEGIPQSNLKKSKETVPMTAITYILGKLEHKLSKKITDIQLSDEMKTFEIWKMKREVLLTVYECCRQINGEVCLVCHFQPQHPHEISCPQIVLPKKGSKYTDIFLWNSLDRLSSDFSAFFENTSGDFCLESGNYKKYVHRNIISSRCGKLGEMISDLRQNQPNVTCMVIPYLNTFTLEIFLKYVYCGSIPDISTVDAEMLFIFGSEISMADLVDLCAKIMVHHLTEENVFDFLQLAEDHEHEKFKLCIIDYILRKNITVSKPWVSSSASNMELALQIQRASDAKSCTS